MRRRLEQYEEEINPQEQRELTQEFFLDGLSDYIRAFIKRALEEAIKKELTEFLGYKPYERAEYKENYRNGSYTRDLTTRFGPIEGISVARDRSGEFEPGVIKRYKSREGKIERDIEGLFSWRDFNKEDEVYNKSTFWERVLKLHNIADKQGVNREQMRQWKEGLIEDDILYLFLDGVNLPIRRFNVSKESLLVAIGITVSGHRIEGS